MLAAKVPEASPTKELRPKLRGAQDASDITQDAPPQLRISY